MLYLLFHLPLAIVHWLVFKFVPGVFCFVVHTWYAWRRRIVCGWDYSCTSCGRNWFYNFPGGF